MAFLSNTIIFLCRNQSINYNISFPQKDRTASSTCWQFAVWRRDSRLFLQDSFSKKNCLSKNQRTAKGQLKLRHWSFSGIAAVIGGCNL